MDRPQEELRQRLIEQGVKFIDATQVYLREDTEIGAGTLIEPFVVFGAKVKIGTGCVIKAFSHLEDCVVGKDGVVGPFARLRGGSIIGNGVGIGNFVEVARSYIADRSAVWHLSFIGDTEIGKEVDIGAGTVTCNFDGFNKHKTKIEDAAFIGSNTTLIAPSHIGGNALVAAGSVINGKIEPDELVIVRAGIEHKSGGAERYRKRKKHHKQGENE